MRARAMAIRCRWPPENSWGYRSRSSGSRPTSAMTRSSAAGTSSTVPRSMRERSGSVMIRPTRMRGSRQDRGSWKTIDTWARSGRRSACEARIDEPAKRTSPSSGRRSPSSTLSRVDFPDPDSPTTPRRWPRAMVRLTWSKAWTALAPVPNRRLRFLASRIGVFTVVLIGPPARSAGPVRRRRVGQHAVDVGCRGASGR